MVRKNVKKRQCVYVIRKVEKMEIHVLLTKKIIAQITLVQTIMTKIVNKETKIHD